MRNAGINVVSASADVVSAGANVVDSLTGIAETVGSKVHVSATRASVENSHEPEGAGDEPAQAAGATVGDSDKGKKWWEPPVSAGARPGAAVGDGDGVKICVVR